MSTDTDQPAQPVGLGTHSARGIVYLFAGSAVAKLVSIGAQVALSYLLSENDFGVVGLAYTITTFIQVIEQAGVGDVLVQRKNFQFWAIPAFWLATCLGVSHSPVHRNRVHQWGMLGFIGIGRSRSEVETHAELDLSRRCAGCEPRGPSE